MKYSVAICTYNGEKYVQSQIESILNQTEPVYEIIICDDGSTDNTISILTNIAKSDKRIKIIINEKNLGYIKNFEKALNLCQGDWIFLSDQDDLWDTKKVEIYKHAIETNKEILGLVFGNAQLINEKNESLNETLYNLVIKNNLKSIEKINNPENMLSSLLNGNFMTGATIAVRKDLLTKIVPFSSKFVHDRWLGITISLLGYKTGYINEIATYYRIHKDQCISVNVSNNRNENSKDHVERKLLGEYYSILKFIEEKANTSTQLVSNVKSKLIEKKDQHISLRIHEYILKNKRFKKINLLLKYLLVGKYKKWVNKKPEKLFSFLHFSYDCLRFKLKE